MALFPMFEIQMALCRRVGADFQASPPDLKVGVALATVGKRPINGLRHPPEGDTTGWYIWAGEDFSQALEFFEPVHVEHIAELLPRAIPYLGLAPGWRFLLAENQEDLWFDPMLLDPA